MGDSEDEFRLRDPPRRRRPRPREAGTAAAPAAGPPPLPPESGLKRGGAPRLAGRKRQREAGGEPLAAPARSRSEAGLGGKRPRRAETRGRGRPPPPLLLQGPEEARRGLEARAALLLSEAPAAPRTPPLPASRWKGPPAIASPAVWLWELSSLTGIPAVAPWGADQRPEFNRPGPPAELQETERFPSRTGECYEAGSPRDADTLRDLLVLAGEGLTFTQWSLDVGRLEPPEQEQMPDVQQKSFTRLLEKQQQQQQLSRKCSCEAFPLGSLAAAFKEMVNNPHLSDIQIQVDSGEVFYAHMFVLYARCPQLLQFVDHRRFVVAEEGEVGVSRVLLHDAPGDAVALVLKYLYTAEHFIPQHLLSDVIDLAIRFGIKELAVLCEGQPSEEVRVEKPADDKDKVESFEELLRSMWQDEEEETESKSVCRDEISDSMNEQELEEIYEFVATQRRMTSDETRKEKVCTEYRHDEVEKKIGQDGASCPRKVLEKRRRSMTIRESEIKSDQESSKLKTFIASMEKDLKKYSVEFQRDFKEIVSFRANTRKEPTSEIHLGLAGDSTHSNHLERSATHFSVSEMKCCSLPEENINIAEDEITARNFPRRFQAPAKDLQMTLPRDLEVPFSPVTSASQPNILDRLPSQNDKQENISRKGRAPVGSLEKSGVVNPQDLNIMGDYIVVLDSDEELGQEAEKKQAEAASNFSEQRSWHKDSPAGDVMNCWSTAPSQEDVSKVGDGLGTLTCNETRYLSECHQPLDSHSHKEGSFCGGLSCSEGRTLVVPEMPVAAWSSLGDVQVEKSRLNSSLEKQWTYETQTEPLSCSCKPLQVLSSTSLLEIMKPDNGLCAAEKDVMVVDDSEQEQEAVPLCSRGIFVEPLEVITANARNPLRTSVHMFDMQNNHPMTVVSRVTNSAATFHFGVGDLLLDNSKNWPREDADNNESGHAYSSLSTSIPVPEVFDLACQARDISCVTPLMPFPPYSSMDTPQLKKELSRFGVRALPKQQMVLKLKEIFQFTHQQAGTDSKKKSTPVSTSSFQKLQQKSLSPYRLLQGSPNMTNHADLSEGGAQRPEVGLWWPKGAALPANRLTDGEGNGDFILTTSEASAGTAGTGSETYAGSQSSSVECKISMLAEKEENVPASQIATSGENQKLDILKHYIHSNPSLCQKILLYHPIELSVLHAELKQNGIRIALNKLLDFLDTSGITFTTAEARREKKRHLHRCKKKGQR